MKKVKIPQIPKHLLVHEIVLKSYQNNRGSVSFAEDELIKNVRFECDSNASYGDGRSTDIITNLVFIDVVNSSYSDIEAFKIESIIVFKNVEYKITKVIKIDALDKLHHLELEVV